jgi:hypothetical protein
MQNDSTDRTEINRLADDGCPNTCGDTHLHDLSKLWAGLADEDCQVPILRSNTSN